MNPWLASTVLAIVFAVLGVFLFVQCLARLKKKKWIKSMLPLSLMTTCFVSSAFFLLLRLSIEGYHNLIREEVIGTVQIIPKSDQTFEASVITQDGQHHSFFLNGDEIQIDAHILKWHNWLNLIGLHSQYELDRISGRYRDLEASKLSARSENMLRGPNQWNAFLMQRQYPILERLVDARYGSAVFVPADKPMVYELTVSHTGLIMRPLIK